MFLMYIDLSFETLEVFIKKFTNLRDVVHKFIADFKFKLQKNGRITSFLHDGHKVSL